MPEQDENQAAEAVEPIIPAASGSKKVIMGFFTVLALALALTVVGLTWALNKEKQENHRLATQLADTRKSLAAEEAALAKSRQTAEALGAKIGQLTMVLTNSTFELSAARQRIQQLEAQPVQPTDLLASLPQDEETQRQVARYAPVVTLATNAGHEVRTCVFKTLYGKDDQILGHDLEFSAVYGKRAAFKELGSARRVAFDVDDLHPYVLAHLRINPEQQKQQQARQDDVWRRVEAAGIKLAEEEESRREAKREADAAARVEAAKQMEEERQKAFQEEMQRRSSEAEALRAEAAMRSADAAMIQALSPSGPIIINRPIPKTGP